MMPMGRGTRCGLNARSGTWTKDRASPQQANAANNFWFPIRVKRRAEDQADDSRKRRRDRLWCGCRGRMEPWATD
jgi:hypothetical protein